MSGTGDDLSSACRKRRKAISFRLPASSLRPDWPGRTFREWISSSTTTTDEPDQQQDDYKKGRPVQAPCFANQFGEGEADQKALIAGQLLQQAALFQVAEQASVKGNEDAILSPCRWSLSHRRRTPHACRQLGRCQCISQNVTRVTDLSRD